MLEIFQLHAAADNKETQEHPGMNLIFDVNWKDPMHAKIQMPEQTHTPSFCQWKLWWKSFFWAGCFLELSLQFKRIQIQFKLSHPTFIADHLSYLMNLILLVHHHLNDNHHLPNGPRTYIVANTITYTRFNIPWNSCTTLPTPLWPPGPREASPC